MPQQTNANSTAAKLHSPPRLQLAHVPAHGAALVGRRRAGPAGAGRLVVGGELLRAADDAG